MCCAGEVELARAAPVLAPVPPEWPQDCQTIVTGDALRLQRAVGRGRLLQVEQRVVLALDRGRSAPSPGRCSAPPRRGRSSSVRRRRRVARACRAVALAWQASRTKLGQPTLRVGSIAAPCSPSSDADAEEQPGPADLLRARGGVGVGHAAGEAGVVRREGVAQVVPGDERDERVDAGIHCGSGELDLAAVGPADHARAAGRGWRRCRAP